jgi:co-chaperonin GroES (HSP10)
MATPSLKAFKPLGDRVLVIVHKPDEHPTLIRPVGYEDPDKHRKATIVSLGTKAKGLKNRDVIIIPTNAGHDVEVNGFKYRLLRVHEIVATL